MLQVMDDIYYELITFDFPDAITGGLRRTTDAFRAVLERTRGDLTLTFQQKQLEVALRNAARESVFDIQQKNKTDVGSVGTIG